MRTPDGGGDVTVGAGYPRGQLAAALVTAATHEDEKTRARAQERVRRWQEVLDGMSSGRLRIGSRTPVKGVPAWATPEVARGGFATGRLAAEGDLEPHEIELARRVGVPAHRGALFAYHLTEAGVADLQAILDSGHYRVRVPEEAALPVVAWLLRAGDRSAALALLDAIGGWTDRLRFAPVPADTPAPDPSILWRYTIGEVRERLAAKRPNPRVAAMNEALTIWNPFADKLLRLWLDTVEDGRVAVRFPDGWRERAQRLLVRYHELAQQHTLCSKHRRPKENLAILRIALEEYLSDSGLSPRQRGRLQQAVDAMVARRGAPGSEAHAALRRVQSRQGRQPTHAALAAVVADRLAALPADRGDAGIEDTVGPVTPDEAQAHGVPIGSAIPTPVRRVALRALAGTIEDLGAAGIVPSAEVFAGLVPSLAAVATTAAYDDPALRRLMAQHYRAFRARRSPRSWPRRFCATRSTSGTTASTRTRSCASSRLSGARASGRRSTSMSCASGGPANRSGARGWPRTEP